MSVDGAGLLALGIVSAEWLVLGWLSGVAWPGEPAPWGPRWVLRLLVGLVLQGGVLVLALLAGVPLTARPVLLGTAVLVALVARAIGKWMGGPARPASRTDEVPAGSPAEHRREQVGWVALGLVLAAALARSLVVPEAGWDAYSHWGLKALAYFLAGGWVDTATAHEYYPPLVPVLETWLYVHRGQVSIDTAKTIWAVLGGAFAVCLGWHVRLLARPAWTAPWIALGGVLGSVQVLDGFWTGQADLPLTAFLTLAILALVEWERTPGVIGRAWLVQAALFAGAAALTKHEGLFRVGVGLGAVVLALRLHQAPLRRLLGPVAVGAVALLAIAPWAIFRASHGIEVTGEHLAMPRVDQVPAIAAALVAALGGVRTGGGLLVALGATGLGWRLAWSSRLRLLTLVVAAELAATLAAFLVTGSDPAVQVATSADRLFAHLSPLWLALAGIVLAETLPGRTPKETATPRVLR